MRQDDLTPERGTPRGMPRETAHPHTEASYGQILREVGISTKDLVQSEIALIKAEMKEATQKASTHLTQAVIFGALLVLSAFPLLAFFVIGLGNLMGGRYALSSFIVAAICAVVGGSMALRAYKKLKDEDLQLPRTANTLSREGQIVEDKVEDVKDAAKGNRNESYNLH